MLIQIIIIIIIYYYKVVLSETRFYPQHKDVPLVRRALGRVRRGGLAMRSLQGLAHREMGREGTDNIGARERGGLLGRWQREGDDGRRLLSHV